MKMLVPPLSPEPIEVCMKLLDASSILYVDVNIQFRDSLDFYRTSLSEIPMIRSTFRTILES